jgi:glycosyltransferase involved in cell wall biosynthesis
MATVLLEGPFESDYSLAVVNRGLARGLLSLGITPRLHQRDNVTHYFPNQAFLQRHSDLAPLFVREIEHQSFDVHSRYIYPPHSDGFRGSVRAIHCYGWEESVFPAQFVEWFNGSIDLITVMSGFVGDVLAKNGVRVPIHVVGLGADHILSEAAKPLPWLPTDEYLFLHVSSCFPRKAPEVLVRAFASEFKRSDDVRLIIKTFRNPHNEIDRIVREMDSEYPHHAPIDIIWDPLDTGEMRSLYERAGCLVSPSRGEGFGLPVAEAMFLNCPVIATMYSGQADICKEDHCWPVQYCLEPAKTHLTEGQSVWANPMIDSLRAQMRSVYRSTAAERGHRTQLAHGFVASRFTWRQVAEQHWKHCEGFPESNQTPSAVPRIHDSGPTIGFVTSWNSRCGIAEYSRYLATSLPKSSRFVIFANHVRETTRSDEPFVVRCWDPSDNHDAIENLVRIIVASGVDAVSLQFNFGFFGPAQLDRLVEGLRRQGIPTAITLHAVRHDNFTRIRPALSKAAFCICHRASDVEAVRALGVDQVLLRRQGIASSQLGRPRNSKPGTPFVVSCFGFFLPPKGIYQLIQAFALVRNAQPLLRLKLLNALYPIPESAAYAAACLGLVQQKGLGPHVSVTTAFLEHEEILEELAASQLVILPYLHSTESSSAAGAFAVASLVPVLCSDLSIFDELGNVVHRFPAGNVTALANKILELADDAENLNRYRQQQEQLVRTLAWPVIASDFVDLIAQHISVNLSPQ